MAQTTQNVSFGLVFVFSALPSLSCIPQQYTADYNCKTQVSNKKKRNNNKKNLLLGPFSSSLLSLSCIPQYTAYQNCKTQVSNKKKEIITTKLTFGPNDASGVIWARFCRRRLPCAFPSVYSINRIYIQQVSTKKTK